MPDARLGSGRGLRPAGQHAVHGPAHFVLQFGGPDDGVHEADGTVHEFFVAVSKKTGQENRFRLTVGP